MNDIIAKLIASGRATFGHFVGGGGAVSRLFAPPGKGMIITRIKLKAFCDLPAGQLFTSLDAVTQFSWHQLNVFSQLGSQVFNCRHDLNVQSITDLVFPQGEHVFDVFINVRNYAFFTLTHAPQGAIGFQGWSTNIDRVPDDQDIPERPFNYGVTPAGLTTVTHLQFNAASEARPMGNINTPINATSFQQLQWPIDSTTRLNPPDFTRAFVALTIPVLNIDYILIDGQPDETFRGAI